MLYMYIPWSQENCWYLKPSAKHKDHFIDLVVEIVVGQLQ